MAIDTARPTAHPTTTPLPAQPGLVSKPLHAALAWSSLAAAIAGVAMLLVGDPYWLGLGLGGWALVAGLLVIARDPQPRAVPYLGAALGTGVLFLWFIMEIVVGLIAGHELTIIGG